MESYSVSIKPSAAKELGALPTLKDRQRATAIVRGLSANPRPVGSLKLAGAPDAYRIRFGSYCSRYTVSDRVRIVAVIEIAHRREAYR